MLLKAAILTLLCSPMACASDGQTGLNQEVALLPDTTVTLRAGQSALFGGVRVTFLQIVSDSRCPEGAHCVWAGDAEVKLGFSPAAAPPQELVLHSNLSPNSGKLLGLKVKFISLRPGPTLKPRVPPMEAVVELELHQETP